MKQVWASPRVRCYDAYKRKFFSLRVVLLHAIQDMPALGKRSGQKIKGKVGCVTCMDRTASRYLKNSHKTVYMRHLRFLRRVHPSRKMMTKFDNTREKGYAPRPYTGKEVRDMEYKINVVLGKGKGSSSKTT